MVKVHCSVTCGRGGECCLSPTLLVVWQKRRPDPVGVLGRAVLVCLAAAAEAASLVQTGRTELSHAQGFSVVSLFYFLLLVLYSLVEAYYVRESLVSALTVCFLPR